MRIELDEFIRQEELFTDHGHIRTVVYYKGSLYVATNNRDGRGIPGEYVYYLKICGKNINEVLN